MNGKKVLTLLLVITNVLFISCCGFDNNSSSNKFITESTSKEDVLPNMYEISKEEILATLKNEEFEKYLGSNWTIYYICNDERFPYASSLLIDFEWGNYKIMGNGVDDIYTHKFEYDEKNKLLSLIPKPEFDFEPVIVFDVLNGNRLQINTELTDQIEEVKISLIDSRFGVELPDIEGMTFDVDYSDFNE